MICLPRPILHRLPQVPRPIDGGLGSRSCIVVAGSGRSGTTWLADVVAQATRSRRIFEPFVHDRHRQLRLLDGVPVPQTDYQLYIPADAAASPQDAALRRILRGSVRHRWCDRWQPAGLFFRRVIKGIRCNLLLAYLARRWPRVKFIYLTRNPLSVVNSQIAMMRQGWDFKWEPAFVLHQPRLMQDWLAPFQEQIAAAATLAEKQTLKWCIENYLPSRQLAGIQNVLFVRYEELGRGERGWSRIAQFLQRRCWSSDRWRNAVGQISPTAGRTADDIRRGRNQRPALTQQDEQTVRKIVTAFGLDAYLPAASSAQ